MMINMKRDKLTVLHVATLNQPIRADLGYGPIETIIHNLDKGLCSLGHRSIVACSGDSSVVGEHLVTVKKSSGGYCSDSTTEKRETMDMHISNVIRRVGVGDIDIIHLHDAKAVESMYDRLAIMQAPIVMTLHVAAIDSRLEGVCQRWCNPVWPSPQVHCVAISKHQKKQYDDLVEADDVVYHGIDVDKYPVKMKPDKGSYLFTIGRVTSVKGQDKAIEIAKKTGSKLIIAGCVQNKAADREFFESLKESIDLFVEPGKLPVGDDYYGNVIKPLLDCDKQIIYIGEICGEHKKQWYRHARATLFPIQWSEPFGLVLVESMACGTPVVALNRGAVPEIVENGKTGFVVDSTEAMIEAVSRIDSIDPGDCRKHVENKFSITSMALNYSELYNQISGGHNRLDTRGGLTRGRSSKPAVHGVKAA